MIPGLLDKAFQLGLAAVVFLRRVDVGIVVKNGQVKVRGQALQCCARARRTAGVQQQLRAGAVQRAQDLFHFKLIVDAVGHG